MERLLKCYDHPTLPLPPPSPSPPPSVPFMNSKTASLETRTLMDSYLQAADWYWIFIYRCKGFGLPMRRTEHCQKPVRCVVLMVQQRAAEWSMHDKLCLCKKCWTVWSLWRRSSLSSLDVSKRSLSRAEPPASKIRGHRPCSRGRVDWCLHSVSDDHFWLLYLIRFDFRQSTVARAKTQQDFEWCQTVGAWSIEPARF